MMPHNGHAHVTKKKKRCLPTTIYICIETDKLARKHNTRRRTRVGASRGRRRGSWRPLGAITTAIVAAAWRRKPQRHQRSRTGRRAANGIASLRDV